MMMVDLPNKLMTYEKAKSEAEKLKNYIDLIERYETDTLKKWVIKQYALSNSIVKIISKSYQENITYNDAHLDREFIVSIIKGEVEKGDELHRILRLGYRKKIKSNKKRVSQWL